MRMLAVCCSAMVASMCANADWFIMMSSGSSGEAQSDTMCIWGSGSVALVELNIVPFLQDSVDADLSESNSFPLFSKEEQESPEFRTPGVIIARGQLPCTNVQCEIDVGEYVIDRVQSKIQGMLTAPLTEWIVKLESHDRTAMALAALMKEANPGAFCIIVGIRCRDRMVCCLAPVLLIEGVDEDLITILQFLERIFGSKGEMFLARALAIFQEAGLSYNRLEYDATAVRREEVLLWKTKARCPGWKAVDNEQEQSVPEDSPPERDQSRCVPNPVEVVWDLGSDHSKPLVSRALGAI